MVPPALALGSEHALNLETTLQAILARCADQPACADAFGDPYARLRELQQAARAEPRSLDVPDPLTQKPRAMRLDGDTVAVVARLFAYAPETAALLPLLVDEALQGRPAPLLAQAALVVDSLVGQINHGMQLSVACAEDAPRLQAQPGDEGRLLGTALIDVLRNQLRSRHVLRLQKGAAAAHKLPKDSQRLQLGEAAVPAPLRRESACRGAGQGGKAA